MKFLSNSLYYASFLLILSCSEDSTSPDSQDLHGCLDSQACNYNPDANIDNNSCEYPDCLGDCGGDAIEDECGVCDGDGSTCSVYGWWKVHSIKNYSGDSCMGDDYEYTDFNSFDMYLT